MDCKIQVSGMSETAIESGKNTNRGMAKGVEKNSCN
jgi:hypothetical protein